MPMASGLYNAVRYVAFNATDNGAHACTNFIYGIVQDNAENSIISVFMCPNELSGRGDQLIDGLDITDALPYSETFDIDFDKTALFDGYQAHNYKLYSYPYIALALDTLSSCTVYRWEFFTSNAYTNSARFKLMGALSPNAEYRISPIRYCVDNIDDTENNINYTMSNFISGFPQCAWAIDSYAAWLAQKSTAEYLNMASTAVGVVSSFAQGNIIGGIQGGIGLASQYNTMVLEQTRGDMPRGNIGGSVDVAHKIKGAYFKHMSITGEYAKQIDSFFDRFGYCVNTIKHPSRKNREYYTYVKTNGCEIVNKPGKAIPCDAVEKIKQIYDNGVTFWTTATVCGDYSMARQNRPLNGGGGFN